jgi:hypothetical protein
MKLQSDAATFEVGTPAGSRAQRAALGLLSMLFTCAALHADMCLLLLLLLLRCSAFDGQAWPASGG